MPEPIIPDNLHLSMLRSIIDSVGGPTIVIFLGGIISLIGAIWAAIDQSSSSRILVEKNEEIAQLSRQIANSVTGGDSFCYLLPLSGQNAAEHMFLVASGTYPLYDVSARIVDLDKFEALTKTSYGIKDMMAQQGHLAVGNVPAGSSQLITPGLRMEGEHCRWNIFFSARNGSFSQELRARKVDGEWRFASRVHFQTGAEPKYVHESVSPDYPKEPDGSINWN